MTQNEKDILLKDLCMRLPYGVNMATPYGTGLLTSIRINDSVEKLGINIDPTLIRIFSADNVKPYLFPLSSMTEEQKNSFPFSYSFLEALIDDGVYFDEDECITLNDMICVIQWCYKNHFDIHGLIPKGLAVDATGKNIY